MSSADTETVKGRLILVVDDSRISGQHEIKIDDFLFSATSCQLSFHIFISFLVS